MLDSEKAVSLDEILCDPFVVKEFDTTARRFAPGFSECHYRVAALKLRKGAKNIPSGASVHNPPARLGRKSPIDEVKLGTLSAGSGVLFTHLEQKVWS